MKKVNILLAVMYVNTLLLAITSFGYMIVKKHFENQCNIFEHLPKMFAIWFVIFIVISIINIISVIRDYKKNNTEVLFKKMKRVKMGLIPFWIINFICYIPISIVFLFIPPGVLPLIGWAFIPLFVLASYIVLCLSSSFSFSYLLHLKKNNILSTKQLVIHTILQFIFVVDIVDTICIIQLSRVKFIAKKQT